MAYLAGGDGEAELHWNARCCRLLQADRVGGGGGAGGSVGGGGERKESDGQKNGGGEGGNCDH